MAACIFIILCELWYFIFHVHVLKLSKLSFGIELAVEFTEMFAIPFLDVIVSPLFFFRDDRSFTSRFHA